MSTEPTPTTMLRCPFCGSRAFVSPPQDEGVGFYVACDGDECFASIGEGYDRSAMPDHIFKTREEAVAAWNRRAS